MKRKARPDRIRASFSDDVAGAAVLALPDRRLWPVALMLAAMFTIFALVEWAAIRQLTSRSVDDVFDLMFLLFQVFWVLGWSVGVVLLGALTFLVLCYRESARLQRGALVLVPRLGPLKIFVEYDLAKIRNVRLEKAGGGDDVRIRFDHGEGTAGLGDSMPRPDGERLVSVIQNAANAAGLTAGASHPARWDPPPVHEAALPKPEPPERSRTESFPPSIASPSGLALIAANLLPLASVLFFGWDLTSIIVLFWAESGVIAFYTALKMAVVGKFLALLAVPFFIGHFGGFMAGHFLLIYAFFVRGFATTGAPPGAREALLGIFDPLWTSLAALVVSHGVSFFTNFIGRREYAGATMNGLMIAPYNRIVVMQLALILGGWVIILIGTPVAALAFLVVGKTVMDFAAHRKEHAGLPGPNLSSREVLRRDS